MLNIKSETKSAFMNGGIRNTLTITFFDAMYDGKDEEGKDKYTDYVINNDKIESNSLSITQSIQSGNKLDFVGCIASTAKFKMVRSQCQLKDKKVEIKLNVDGSDEDIILFTGKVDKVEKDSNKAIVQDVSCYDKMKELLDEKDVTEWYAGLGDDFSMTLKEFRNKLFEHLEIEQVDVSLPRDYMVIRKTLDTDEKTEDDGSTVRKSQITAATLIECICQINAVFGQITNDGKMNYVDLNTEEDPYVYDDSLIIKTKSEDTELKQITSVVLYDGSSEEYKDTGEALAYYPEDKKLVDGDDAVPYEITNNFILYAVKQSDALAIAKDIYEKISKVSYTPCKIETYGMPWMQCGDIIGFYTNDINTVYPDDNLYPRDDLYPFGMALMKTVIMSRTLKGPGLFKDEIEAKGEDINSSVTTINEVIEAERFYRKIGDAKLYSEIEQTKELIQLTVTNEETGVMSQIKQQANRIDAVVERQYNDYSAITTRLEMTENEIDLHAKQLLLESENMKVVTQKVAEFDAQMIDFNVEIVNFNGTKANVSDLGTAGKTVINGANISTGTINCARIGLGSISVDGKEYKDVDWNNLWVPKCYTELGLKRTTYGDVLRDYIKKVTVPTVTFTGGEWVITGTQDIYAFDMVRAENGLFKDTCYTDFTNGPVPHASGDIPDGFIIPLNSGNNWENYTTLSTVSTEHDKGAK